MRLALVQNNPIIGDIHGNMQALVRAGERAFAQGARLALAPELALTGYPPRDLLLNEAVLQSAWRAVEELAARLPTGLAFVLGTPLRTDNAPELPEGGVYNGAVLLEGGAVRQVFAKTLLPTYDVFDETRYFSPGPGPGVFELDGWRFGVTICEDAWNDKDFWKKHRYPADPVEELATQGIDGLINLSASPFSLGKHRVREEMFASLAHKYAVPLYFANQVGGNDDLVFPGRSLALDASGQVIGRGRGFVEDLVIVEQTPGSGPLPADDFERPAEAWAAVVLGTRDYVRKSGFSKALLGLSGGVDSALCAAVAVEALGAENVLGVLMPSPYTSAASIEDAQALADTLGIAQQVLPIEPVMNAFEETLRPAFTGYTPDVTEENIQSRIRGNLLMALSNKYGSLLLTTGNKSELAVGYCTIYGDMAGALGVIADMPKTLVYEVCRWLNRERGEVVPQRILDKAPSAELRPDQKDSDSLPDYATLDGLLGLLVDRHYSVEQCVEAGYDAGMAREVQRLVRRAEFKRRQAPPGIKITDRAFGTGWRMPLAARW
ncbi:NAD+ synthase [Desulfohalobium retbaense]|uniref:Glutamine-dependent NAD(+) synthetase n=1 Tax=Desulfohalobium retbaense (strain ATCC 49708 / DSM 5692 / JCM 16813 / HR100) TaxID=485915 RepID=C8X098_DESRD|nr:NAD+ synthase [Desulfohalobium retbaense]ACV67723.1 NAD+ synthetase [Desulfohalobium retbaense DSM 5692]